MAQAVELQRIRCLGGEHDGEHFMGSVPSGYKILETYVYGPLIVPDDCMSLRDITCDYNKHSRAEGRVDYVPGGH